MNTHADIVVAGGGPAGATIARLLARFGYSVALLEKRRFPRHQIGESLTPQILPILDFVDIRQHVEAAGFLRMVGHTVCWGNTDPRTSYYSPDHTRYGFQAWRADFDTLLLTHAREAGVQVYEACAVEGVRVDAPTPVLVSTRLGTMTAKFFIDASGHAGVLAHQHLRQRDDTYRTLALTGYWQNATGPAGEDFANTLLETYGDGLIWSVPLHNGLRNVTVLLDWQDGQRLRQHGLTNFYLNELQHTSYIREFLTNAQLPSPPRAFYASWYTARTFAGPQFLLVGDAGLCIDPLSSEGVHKAMASAITGAIVANTILKRPTLAQHAIRFYNESQQSTYESHYAQSVQYYQEEQRWSDHPFWQKRALQVQSPKSKVQSQDSKVQRYSAGLWPQAPGPRVVSALRIAPGVTIQPRPVIEGSFVELREVVVAPRYPRGVRFLLNVNVPRLLTVVAAHSAVAEIITNYLALSQAEPVPPESVRQVLARLYQEGIVVSSDATVTA